MYNLYIDIGLEKLLLSSLYTYYIKALPLPSLLI